MPRTDTQLTTDATVIQIETIARANTATRVGTMLNDIVSSKINVDKLDIDGTLIANSDTKVATQKAVKTYVDSKVTVSWFAGDLKQKYVSNAYIAANFDVNGYGINNDLGWRILSSQVPSAAGKVFINRDVTDTDFNEAGKTGGSKTHTLTIFELPAHTHLFPRFTDIGVDSGNAGADGIDLQQRTDETQSTGGGLPHAIMNPYFVVLTLIKL